MFSDKQQAVQVPKLGCFFNHKRWNDSETEVATVFCASRELQRLLNFSEDQQVIKLAQTLDFKKLNWL